MLTTAAVSQHHPCGVQLAHNTATHVSSLQDAKSNDCPAAAADTTSESNTLTVSDSERHTKEQRILPGQFQTTWCLLNCAYSPLSKRHLGVDTSAFDPFSRIRSVC